MAASPEKRSKPKKKSPLLEREPQDLIREVVEFGGFRLVRFKAGELNPAMVQKMIEAIQRKGYHLESSVKHYYHVSSLSAFADAMEQAGYRAEDIRLAPLANANCLGEYLKEYARYEIEQAENKLYPMYRKPTVEGFVELNQLEKLQATGAYPDITIDRNHPIAQSHTPVIRGGSLTGFSNTDHKFVQVMSVETAADLSEIYFIALCEDQIPEVEFTRNKILEKVRERFRAGSMTSEESDAMYDRNEARWGRIVPRNKRGGSW